MVAAFLRHHKAIQSVIPQSSTLLPDSKGIHERVQSMSDLPSDVVADWTDVAAVHSSRSCSIILCIIVGKLNIYFMVTIAIRKNTKRVNHLFKDNERCSLMHLYTKKSSANSQHVKIVHRDDLDRHTLAVGHRRRNVWGGG